MSGALAPFKSIGGFTGNLLGISNSEAKIAKRQRRELEKRTAQARKVAAKQAEATAKGRLNTTQVAIARATRGVRDVMSTGFGDKDSFGG